MKNYILLTLLGIAGILYAPTTILTPVTRGFGRGLRSGARAVSGGAEKFLAGLRGLLVTDRSERPAFRVFGAAKG